ncbi:glucose-6-phosphate dehydrogenase assembly protein OpcA [Gleimia hominis]|uniref:glucose-6-phosphate dehydrogenase assembly protein OpcA n=1 Tax=Gleimia hominis TaxID=595468 RepID=UPI000C80798D|nr:glucose-6-phosphate dehydrogenase assembly protein OpcA [Gleimia hominis]WIK65030.1 glucose-6-phosphate dehydrogenase assembly protein OpcA [Gleimia hominis]
MKITYQNTSAGEVAMRLHELRDQESATVSSVLNLVAIIQRDEQIDSAIEVCGAASHEHPCRVIIVVENTQADGDSLTAQIHAGPDIGPSEVIVLQPSGKSASELDTLVMPLLLADTQIVAFWPFEAPDSPVEHPLGKIAARRITDSRYVADGNEKISALAHHYAPGDTDLAWAASTLWRGLVAAMVDEKPRREIESACVSGNEAHPSCHLLAQWMRTLLGIPVTLHATEANSIECVSLRRHDGSDVSLRRKNGASVAQLERPNLPALPVRLPRRSVGDCLMEELRIMDPDDLYGDVITSGVASD